MEGRIVKKNQENKTKKLTLANGVCGMIFTGKMRWGENVLTLQG